MSIKHSSSFWKWLLCDWLGWHALPPPHPPLAPWRCLRCGRNLLSAVEIKDEEK